MKSIEQLLTKLTEGPETVEFKEVIALRPRRIT